MRSTVKVGTMHSLTRTNHGQDKFRTLQMGKNGYLKIEKNCTWCFIVIIRKCGQARQGKPTVPISSEIMLS